MPRKCPCGKYACFNLPSESVGIRCKKCKTNDMIDVANNRCRCGTLSPVFNIIGEKKGICCKRCKNDEMVDVVNKRCPCGRQPNFNLPGETKGICCSDCKTFEIIDRQLAPPALCIWAVVNIHIQ